jgi:hypothetical protein
MLFTEANRLRTAGLPTERSVSLLSKVMFGCLVAIWSLLMCFHDVIKQLAVIYLLEQL